jgi:hypothetical protein
VLIVKQTVVLHLSAHPAQIACSNSTTATIVVAAPALTMLMLDDAVYALRCAPRNASHSVHAMHTCSMSSVAR